MSRLYQRQIEIVIGGRLYREHEIKFTASLSLSPDPDDAEIRLYNLSDDDRSKAESAGDTTQVVIRAGYRGIDPLPSIFSGRWNRATTEREGPNLITIVSAASALQAREYGRQLNRSYRAGTQVSTVVRDLLTTLEVGEGTLRDTLDSIALQGAGSELRAPIAVTGPAWRSLVELLESNGLRVTTQGNELVTVGINNALDRTAIVLNERTGLRGVPSIDREGLVKAQAAMIPGLVPGRLVKIESELLTGQFRVETCTYTGSLYGSDFGVSFEGKTTS